MRKFIAAIVGLVGGGGLVMTLNGELWYTLLILPAVLFCAWLVFDYLLEFR